MNRSAIVASLLAALLGAPVGATTSRPFTAARSFAVDTTRRLDINQLTLHVANDGILGHDRRLGNWGLLFPRASTSGLLYSSGLMVGARVAGELRVAVAHFASEFTPGTLRGSVPDDPNRPEYRVWKVKAWTGAPSDTAHVERTPAELAADPTLDPLAHHGWSEYLANAVPFGAPTRPWSLPAPGGGSQMVQGPDVPGQLMLWSVFHDGDPARHTSNVGSTAPLGIEVRQSVFGYGTPGPESRAAFVRWRIVNRSGLPLDSLRVAYWMDADLGSHTDDFVGCDTTRSLGFAYNAQAFDAYYDSRPPALGADLLDDTIDPVRGRNLGMDAFAGYNEGRELMSPAQTWALMSGAPWSGRPPEAGPFDRTGDPLTGSGDLDEFPGDRRLLLARLHGTLAPGDSLDVTVALVAAQGANRLDSFAQLLCVDDLAQQLHAGGFPESPPLPGPCPPGPVDCPRTADWYAQQCQLPGELTAAELDSLAAALTRHSVSLAWGPAAGRDSLCALFADASDARSQALREYAALLANAYARGAQATPSGSPPIHLDPTTLAACSALPARTVGELVETAPMEREFSAVYLNLNPDHRRPIDGVPSGLSSFGGGGGSASQLLGSTLDPHAQPDSFTTVRVVFDRDQPQFAHRYLRFELAGGGSPPGVKFRYAGYRPVPFTARDSVTGVALDVGFVERCLVDAAGTILPRAQQPATFDSTWAPDTSLNGGHEILMVARRPLRGTPRAELARDDAFTTQPWLYALVSRRRTPFDEIDNGDAFAFRFSVPPSPGVDARLIELAALPPWVPGRQAQYESIRDCLASVNRGDWLTGACDEAAAQPPSVLSVIADVERVTLRWSVPPGEREQLHRLSPDVDFFQPLAQLDVGASGVLEYQDVDVRPGARYTYRLGPAVGLGPYLESVVDVPLPASIALSTFLPNPARDLASVRFTLRSAAPATLQLLDIAGRIIARQDVGTLGPGSHTVTLRGPIPPGVYLLKLEQAGQRVIRKGVILR